jgi:hypothetical protein
MVGDDSGAGLAEHLTYLYRDQASSATWQQRASVRRWQATDRYYQEVQLAAAQDPNASDEARDIVDDLVALARPLPETVEVWRGVRSVDDTFGVSIEAMFPDHVGEAHDAERFLATSTSRDVATAEFTAPSTSPALLRVIAQEGTLALWVPPLGILENAGQRELLFLPSTQVLIIDVDRRSELPIVTVSLSNG